MKLRHIVIASAVSCSLGSIAWAQQSSQQAPAQPQEPSMQQSQGGASASKGAQAENPEVIRQVQKSLNDQGYNAGPVDGVMGPKTQSALKNFQQAKGMQATGQLDEETLAELDIQGTGMTGAGEPEKPAGTATGAGEPQDQTQQPGGQQEEGQRPGQSPTR